MVSLSLDERGREAMRERGKWGWVSTVSAGVVLTVAAFLRGDRFVADVERDVVRLFLGVAFLGVLFRVTVGRTTRSFSKVSALTYASGATVVASGGVDFLVRAAGAFFTLALVRTFTSLISSALMIAKERVAIDTYIVTYPLGEIILCPQRAGIVVVMVISDVSVKRKRFQPECAESVCGLAVYQKPAQ